MAEKGESVESLTQDAYESYEQINSQDAKEMAKLGKQQKLRRNLNFWSSLGFACVTMVTWEGLLTTFAYGLSNGGPEGLVIGFFVIWVGYGLVVASLAEMMSMWPTSGGQYHWTYSLAPPKWAPVLSYIVGWQSVVAWHAATASATFFTATMIQGLFVLNYPSYDYQLYQGTLLMFAIIALGVFISTVGVKLQPIIDYLALVLHLVIFVVVVAVVVAMTPHIKPSHEVFEVFFNEGHYPTQGVSFFVGLQGVMYSWLGADGAIHMAEEIQNASTVLPWALIGSILVNGCLGFAIILVILFCGGNLTKALDSPTGYPVEEIFTYATGSVGGGTALSSLVILMLVLATMLVYTSTSRELWSFARDNGVPGSRYLAVVHPKYKLPLGSLAVVFTLTILLSLINIGSQIAFNAIVSLAIAGYMGTYFIPLSLVAYRRIQAVRGRGRDLPWGPWRFGRWSGIVLNLVSLAWILIIFFWSFWPRDIQGLTLQTMNWSSLAWASITLFAAGFWILTGRRTYSGPVRDAAGGEIEPIFSWSDIGRDNA